MGKSRMDHFFINEVGRKFLRYEKHCGVVGVEVNVYGTREIPDVVGFKTGDTYLIESKTSRADFLADAKKIHRFQGKAIGNYRYFLCPDDVINIDDLPEGWGLLWVGRTKARVIKEVDGTYFEGRSNRERFKSDFDRDLLYGIARKLQATPMVTKAVKILRDANV